MGLAIWRAAAMAVAVSAAMLPRDGAHALSFEERWRSLFAESEVTSDAVSAKAEMARADSPKIERRNARPSRVERPRASRHRHAARRGERRREWYKGGRKWHYVYAKRKRSR